MSLSITAVSFGIRRSRVVTAAAEAAHVSTDGRVFLAVQKTALLKTSEEAVLGCLSTAVHGRSALRPVAVETRPNVRSEPYFGRAELATWQGRGHWHRLKDNALYLFNEM